MRYTFLLRFRDFWPLWNVLVRLYGFCCTIFVRDILMRFHACLTVVRSLDEITRFSAAEIIFRWCDVRTVESWMLKDAGD
jgi:hypothetical protein